MPKPVYKVFGKPLRCHAHTAGDAVHVRMLGMDAAVDDRDLHCDNITV